jgi:DNA polymerase (family 10)
MNTVQEMATFCQEQGFEYFAICDHSKSAFYANGLSEERVLQQHQEVNQLNAALNNFKIFKGIESDILNDGNLDYDPDILKTFDLIVASVHSVLKMDEARATARLIKAIENPFTRILGHPSGRLLLSREGYPLDYKKIIDACAANNVAIELNAHPYRLDIDWRWIPYCMEKGVLISINPDAHEKEGLLDVKWGIISARKGWLTKEHCLNTKSLAEFEQWLQSK